MAEEVKKPSIIILGGGFGGIETARKLGGINANVILISDKTYFEYYPALYRVVTGTSPIEVCIPLTEMVPQTTEIVNDKINKIDLLRKGLVGASGATYSYDYLVIALGSETTYFDVPGLADLSHGFKSIKEAEALKEHLVSLFREHEHPTQGEKIAHFHIVIVGGGPSGIEVAGDLLEHMRSLAKEFKTDPSFLTIDVIEAAGRLLPMLPAEVSARVEKRLRKLGANIFLNRTLIREEVESVYLHDMSLQAKTLIWTAGTRLNQLLTSTEGLRFNEKKRVEVDSFMRVPGHEDVFVVGDAAGTPYSGLAQTAIYDGAYVAKYIRKTVKNKPVKAYVAKKNAYAIPVGANWGVLVVGPLKIYGIIAYLIRHMIDFSYFAPRLGCKKLFSLFFEGWKYRNVYGLEEKQSIKK